MNNYNTHLENLRKNRGLSLKQAAKEIGIHHWSLYFYENGYFRPHKRSLEKLEKFYGEKISLEGEDAYPAPTKEKEIKSKKQSLFVKRIVLGALSAALLASIGVGTGLFVKSVSNSSSFYGQTYNEMKKAVEQEGAIGHDLVTSLEYHYVTDSNGGGTAMMTFYEKESMLYFNECTYSITTMTEKGIERYHFQFGSNLTVNSFNTKFTYGNWSTGTSFSCYLTYNSEHIDEIKNFKILVDGGTEVDKDIATQIVNSRLSNVESLMSKLLSDYIGREVSFSDNFLPDREQGRKINFALQIVGLILILSGIVAFFIVFSMFVYAMIANIKPRLVNTEPEKQSNKYEPLPKDLKIEFGIPDMFVIIASKIMQYGSMTLFIVAFLAKLGLPLPAFMGNNTFLTTLKILLLAGIFLEQFIMMNRIKKATTLFNAIVYNLGFFLFIATLETVVISITNAWGYDFASIIFNYIPGNVYQVVAVHYLIFLFLFFQPSFLAKNKKHIRIIWHSLSLIPLAFLITAYFVSNAYAFKYGVRANIFLTFWFPNGFLSLSLVSILFMYLIFALRLFYERKFGLHKAQFFFYGDRYTLIENGICAILILIAAIIDMFFVKNQYAYYLGIDGNEWILFLIPFILLCKYTPNNQQSFIIGDIKE